MLESDKDTAIFIFYKNIIELNLNVTIFKKENSTNKLLLYEKTKNDIFFDYTFDKNYQSRKSSKNKIIPNNKYTRFYYPYNNNKLPNLDFYIFSDTDNKYYTIDNFNYGFNTLKTNDNYISQLFYNKGSSESYLFYQYINCQNSTNGEGEIIIYVNEEIKEKLDYSLGSFLYFNSKIDSVSFSYHIKEKSIFYFFISKYNYNERENINPDFNIYFKSRNEIIV